MTVSKTTPWRVGLGSFALLLAAALMIGVAAPAVQAQAKPEDKAQAKGIKAEQQHRTQDIAQHQTMAQAHADAAKCLESGKPEKQCHEALRQACQGVALGRFCGMKHSH